jgi:CubicO group peptidase (beta-lactamase class C family)
MVGLIAVLIGVATLTVQNQLPGVNAQYGPGNGPWERATPESVGLDPQLLTEAARQLERNTPNRYCFNVVKDGKLVHESYFEQEHHERFPGQRNVEHTRYEVDSAGKTMQALMVGVGVTKGLYDLDTPLADYGVTPHALFAPGQAGNRWWDELTLRHVLSQTTGVGRAQPGTAFTYDSDDYIAHASHLIEAVTHTGSGYWATENFAVPLGLPDLYTEDGEHTDIGGGQMMSCNDLLRVGQLVLNRGLWKRFDKTTGAASTFQLVSEAFVDELMRPQHPQFLRNYGLLTWLNAPPRPDQAECCAARWCGSWTGPTDPTGRVSPGSQWLPDSMLGSGSPPDAAIAVGWLGRTMIIVPSRNLVAVTLGSSWGSGLHCDGGQGYSEAFTAETIWRSMGRALEVNPTPPPATAQPPPPVSPPPCPAPVLPSTTTASFPTAQGSCTCYCPPDEGFGQCFPANSAAECNALVSHPLARSCSPVAVLRECSDTVASDNMQCGSLAITGGAVWDRCVETPCMECTQTNACPHPVQGAATESCQCEVTKFGSCTYQAGGTCNADSLYTNPQPCVDNYRGCSPHSCLNRC